MTADKGIEEILNQELTRLYEAGEKAEQDRILDLIHRYKGKPDFTLANLEQLIKPEETPTYRWYKTQIEQNIDKIVILSEETKRELAEEEAELRQAMSRRELMNEDPAAYFMMLGAEQEQERIIKLLEADMCSDWADQIPLCCDGACRAYADAIALIKGEQK